jgi:hypothetical protein
MLRPAISRAAKANDLPNVSRQLFEVPTQSALQHRAPSTHAPRILLL